MKKTITQVTRMRSSYVQHYSDGTMQKFKETNVVSVPTYTVEAYAQDFAAQIASQPTVPEQTVSSTYGHNENLDY